MFPCPGKVGHVPRPPDFTIENIVFIRKSVSELPLAVLTLTTELYPHSWYREELYEMFGDFSSPRGETSNLRTYAV